MRDILIVTGTCGVGKSSLCWAWADRRKGAVVHCDSFRSWIRNSSLRRAEGYQEGLLAKHAAALATDYLAMGLDVAIDNVWTPAGLDFLQKQLGGQGRISIFWLNCSSQENHDRDRARSSSDFVHDDGGPSNRQMGARLDELQQQLEGMDWPASVVRLDTSGELLGQTLERIESFLECRNADTCG